MKRVPAKFLNADLELKSRANLGALERAWVNRVIPIHTGKWGRRQWLRLELIRQPRTPAEAVAGFSRLVASLRGRGRVLWTRAAKELDIGVQASVGHRAAEWLIEPKLIRAAARMEVSVRITVYAPESE